MNSNNSNLAYTEQDRIDRVMQIRFDRSSGFVGDRHDKDRAIDDLLAEVYRLKDENQSLRAEAGSNTEKLEAAVAEFLAASGLNITTLQGFKLRAVVKHNNEVWGAGDEEILGVVNYYSTNEFLRRKALDAPTDNNDLFARERNELG